MPDRSIIGRKPTLLPYHGWLVVAAAFLVALYGFGLGFYGPGIYLVALKALRSVEQVAKMRGKNVSDFRGVKNTDLRG